MERAACDHQIAREQSQHASYTGYPLLLFGGVGSFMVPETPKVRTVIRGESDRSRTFQTNTCPHATVYIHPLHTVFVTVYTRIRMPGYILIELILVFACYTKPTRRQQAAEADDGDSNAAT